MFLHGGNQGFCRHLKEPLLETTHQRNRPFVQGGDFVQQIFINHGFATGFLLGQLGHTGTDLLPALGEIGNHVAFLLENDLVVVWCRHNQGFRAVEAVTAGLVTRSQAHDGRLNHLVAEQHDYPVHRAHEFGAVGTPAHALGNRQAGQGLLHQFRHQFHGGLALLDRAVDHPGTLVGFQGVELVRSYAQRGGEPGQCAGRVAGIVERCFDGRATFFNWLVRLGI